MFICKDCGHVFEDAFLSRKIHDELDGSPSEIYDDGCPACGGDYEEASICWSCDEYHSDEGIYGRKWCLNCLLNEVTYENFLAFATSRTKTEYTVDVLEEFIWQEIFKIPAEYAPECGSKELRQYLIRIYEGHAHADTVEGSTNFLERIRSYLRVDEDLCEDFAEWLIKSKK